jgi:hypothetical protein
MNTLYFGPTVESFSESKIETDLAWNVGVEGALVFKLKDGNL